MPDTRNLRRRNIVVVKDVQECLNCINAFAVLNYPEYTGLHEEVLYCVEHYSLFPFNTNWPDGCEWYKEVPEK